MKNMDFKLKTLFLFLTLLYNSLQSVANQGLENSFFQPFTVIYLDVRSLIVGDLVEILSKKTSPYSLIQIELYDIKYFHLLK
jgi:hypothetical protein